MSPYPIHGQTASYIWLQHNVPWLGLFALFMALLRDEPGLPGSDFSDHIEG